MTSQKKTTFVLLLLIAALLSGIVPTAAAEGGQSPLHVIESDEVDRLFRDYVAEKGLDADLISVAYVYPETSETWYHLEDKWYYSASLYKVPLMMILAERESEGELTQDSVINGMTLSDIEETVLVDSNNDVAYSTMLSIAQPDVCRGMFLRYAGLPEDYYTWDFYGGSYFTARFMSDVMTTLYREPERFPHLISRMKQAQPGHYFRLNLGDRFEIAQKYGSYHEMDGADWNHTAGIVFTPHPFILTVMTRYGGMAETVIADLAELFCAYTLQADERLAARQAEERTEEKSEPAPTEENGDPAQELFQEAVQNDPDKELVSQNSGNSPAPAEEPREGKESVDIRTDGAGRTRLFVLSAAVGLTVFLIVLATVLKKKKRSARQSRQRRIR
ncbi:MAG: hypothetical protein IJV40_12535 [Oscillospiraceae bacterium]|nr:hypothetical protein [Oscillospiraceae bacterium]